MKLLFAALFFFLTLGVQSAEAAIDVERFRRAAQALTGDENTVDAASRETECGDGEFKKGNECIPCTFALPGCVKCSSSDSCSECTSEFELTPSGKCRRSGCDDISINGKKHPQIKINGSCSFVCKDGKNCAACDTDGLCTKCLDGYKMSSDKLNCNDCPEHCAACENRLCSACDKGYTLLEGRCFEGEIVCPAGTARDNGGCCRIQGGEP